MSEATLRQRFRRPQLAALIVAAAAAVVLIAALFLVGPTAVVGSYLFGFIFFLMLALGGLPVLMTHRLTGGRWGETAFKVLMPGVLTLPLMAVLVVPLLVGMGAIYHWVDHPEELLGSQHVYLNQPFFIARSVVYFIVWCLLALGLARWVWRGRTVAAARLSGGGLVLFFITVTLAGIDYLMSLDPHWFSTMWGLIFMFSAILGAVSLAVVVLVLLRHLPAFHKAASTENLHDMGNLLLMLVALRAYLGFSQFLITWSGNLPEEVVFYLRRPGFWQWVVLGLIAFHFVVPLFLLMVRYNKHNPRALGAIAGLIFAGQIFDAGWLTIPYLNRAWPVHWLDAVALLAVGGLWAAVYLWQLPVWAGFEEPASGAQSHGAAGEVSHG